MSQVPSGNQVTSTPRRALVVAALFGGLAGWLLAVTTAALDVVPPSIPWSAPVGLFVVGRPRRRASRGATHQQIQVRRERMEPQRAVAFLVLGKASALGGALVAGGYLGYALSFVGRFDADGPRERVVRSLVAVVGGVALVVAGLLLERACRVPFDEDEERERRRLAEELTLRPRVAPRSDRTARPRVAAMSSRTGPFPHARDTPPDVSRSAGRTARPRPSWSSAACWRWPPRSVRSGSSAPASWSPSSPASSPALLAWRELAEARRRHAQRLLAVDRRHGDTLRTERTRNTEVVDALERAPPQHRHGRRRASAATIAQLRGEVGVLTTERDGLREQVAERDSLIGLFRASLREQEVALLAVRAQQAELAQQISAAADAEVHALPRRPRRRGRGHVLDPQMAELAMVLPNYETTAAAIGAARRHRALTLRLLARRSSETAPGPRRSRARAARAPTCPGRRRRSRPRRASPRSPRRAGRRAGARAR